MARLRLRRALDARTASDWKNVSGDRRVHRAHRSGGDRRRVDVRRLSADERLGDALFTGLRLTDGIDLDGNRARATASTSGRRYGADLEPFRRRRAVLRAMATASGLTRQGMLLAHEVMTVFV